MPIHIYSPQNTATAAFKKRKCNLERKKSQHIYTHTKICGHMLGQQFICNGFRLIHTIFTVDQKFCQKSESARISQDSGLMGVGNSQQMINCFDNQHLELD